MLYKNTYVMVHLPNNDIDFFDIVSGVLLGYTLTPYLFIISLSYILQTLSDIMKENDLTLKKKQEANDIP